MAARVRRWAVHPDTVIHTGDGEVACVSRQAMVEALMDGEAFLARTGGILVVTVGRQPTDLPGEAVTTHAVVEWRDSPRATLEEERPSRVLPEPADDGSDSSTSDEAEQAGLEEAASAEPDGLDPSKLEEEDVSSIPAHAR